MARFSEVARVTASELGGDAGTIPDFLLLWRAMLRIAEHTTPMNPTPTSDGRLGVLMTGSEYAAAEALWPGRSKDEIVEVMRETGRKRMVMMRQRPSQRGQGATYWVALAPMPGMVAPEHEPTKAERAEAKVTPAQAGEDREPAPVVVRRPRKAAKTLNYPKTRVQRSRADIQAFNDLVFEHIKGSPVPLAIPEVQAALVDATGVEPQNNYARAIHQLRDAGKLFGRIETTEEFAMRRATLGIGNKNTGHPYVLWWPRKTIPIRESLPEVAGWRRVERNVDVRRPVLVDAAVLAEAEASVALDHADGGQTVALEPVETAPPAPRVTDMSADNALAPAIAAVTAERDAAMARLRAIEEQWREADAQVKQLERALDALRNL